MHPKWITLLSLLGLAAGCGYGLKRTGAPVVPPGWVVFDRSDLEFSFATPPEMPVSDLTPTVIRNLKIKGYKNPSLMHSFTAVKGNPPGLTILVQQLKSSALVSTDQLTDSVMKAAMKSGRFASAPEHHEESTPMGRVVEISGEGVFTRRKAKSVTFLWRGNGKVIEASVFGFDQDPKDVAESLAQSLCLK